MTPTIIQAVRAACGHLVVAHMSYCQTCRDIRSHGAAERAAEREACAQIADAEVLVTRDYQDGKGAVPCMESVHNGNAARIAAAIRARSNV